ncbi:MAG: phage tail sheath subtilisin-like domain-containing protein [Butyricicoccaceae bacterium]
MLTGGTTGAVQDAAYQTFLDKIEPYSFNAVGCDTKNSTVKGLFANWTRRLRDEQGVKFQCVLHGYPAADYEGVISVKNGLVGAADDPSAVLLDDRRGSCVRGQPLDDQLDLYRRVRHRHELHADPAEKAIKAGEFTFHRVGDQTRVLTDINTFVSVIGRKERGFLVQSGYRACSTRSPMTLHALFNSKYIGKVAERRLRPREPVERHCSAPRQLQTIRAIENFDSSSVTVSQGDRKKSVAVEDHVQPVSAMEQLYMKVIVE